MLYAVWLLADVWYVLYRKPYIHQGMIHGFSDFIKDVFLGSTFPGSWFISALVISMIIIYYASRYIHPLLLCCMSVAVSLYTLHPEIFPTDWLVIHQWYSEHIRLEMNLSFPFALVWVSMGQLLATYLLQFANRHKRLMCISLSVIAVCYLLDTVMDIDYISLVTVYVSAIFVFILCDAIKQQPRLSAHTRLSILMFFSFLHCRKKGTVFGFGG